MPIRTERFRLVDDSRTFSPEDLTEVWAWLDSFDAQPLRPRVGELIRTPLTFCHASYVFGEKTYSVAKCSDGREVLGSLILPAPGATNVPMEPAQPEPEVKVEVEASQTGFVFARPTASGNRL